MRNRRADLAWTPLLIASAGLSLNVVLTDDGTWLSVAMIVLAYPAGRRMASLSPALWVFTVVAGTGLALAVWRAPEPLPDWLSLVLIEFFASVLPWWVGRYRRLRAEQVERERGILVEQARLRERARIAQDMHDSLGHELALIALHGGALELAAGLTDEQRRAAGELRACAVRATGRLHDIVQVLGSTDAAAELRPADESIDDLVGRTAAAGVRVRLCHDGPAPFWSQMTSQAAHRVVQESLTNAARHAPGARVTVTVARQRVEVVNDAADRPGGPAGSGQGLIGLDERIRLVGGRLTAGQRSDGGWAVTAVLPDGTEPPDDGPPGVELGHTRRRLLQNSALTLGIGLALVAAIVAVEVVTAGRTSLPDDRYDQLRLGESRAAVERLLPVRDIGRTPNVVATPTSPAGAACVYYLAGGLFEPGPDVYQLCFVDGVLVAKNRFRQA
ncbi:sensor histidine kinase [Actinophytocola sp.]|uniref:sensor histidine kinase n=1 Tax=Actinophytocola sp. TaxID=1872138 RepID=UPI002ED2EDFB